MPRCCPGQAGDMEELLTPNVLNLFPLSSRKENALPVVEISCTVRFVQPLKQEGTWLRCFSSTTISAECIPRSA
jgi:hypothetical protein